MPLCLVSRVNKTIHRHYSCIIEHKMIGNKFVGCGKILDITQIVLPNELKRFAPTRAK